MSQEQFQKPYSDETAKLIDDEVRNLINEQYIRAKKLLSDRRDALEKLAHELLNKEVILKSDVEQLIGSRPFQEKKQIPDPEEESTEGEQAGEEQEKNPAV
jgi:AFG3 family protein